MWKWNLYLNISSCPRIKSNRQQSMRNLAWKDGCTGRRRGCGRPRSSVVFAHSSCHQGRLLIRYRYRKLSFLLYRYWLQYCHVDIDQRYITLTLASAGCIFKTHNSLVMTLCHDFQSPNLGLLPWCIFKPHFLLLPCILEPWCIFKTVLVITLLLLLKGGLTPLFKSWVYSKEYIHRWAPLF